MQKSHNQKTKRELIEWQRNKPQQIRDMVKELDRTIKTSRMGYSNLAIVRVVWTSDVKTYRIWISYYKTK